VGVKSFLESGYKFEFGSEWNMIKYDDHRFYKILSGHSMSGVDFAGIANDETAYLIEIKNFTQYKNEANEKLVDELISEIVEKGIDSIQLIKVIKKYLERKFWYKALYNLVERFTWINPEWKFWTKLHDVSIVEKNAIFLLLINADYNLKEIQVKLKEVLKPYFQGVMVLTIEDGNNITGINISKQ